MGTHFQKILVLLAFYLGAYTLIHEIIWIRMLTFYYGSLLYIVGIVTITLFLGFAIGNMMFGTIIDKPDYSPNKMLTLYGITSIALTIASLFSYFIIKEVTPLPLNVSSFHYHLVTGSVIFIILIIPCALFGGIVPLLFKTYGLGRKESDPNTPFIYAIYTLGGCFGCVLFYQLLFPAWGAYKTVFVFFLISSIISVTWVVFLFILKKASRINPLDILHIRNKGTSLEWHNPDVFKLRIISLFSGFLVMGYEMVWLRYVDQHLLRARNVQTVGIVFGIFIFGLGAGAYLSHVLCKKYKNIKINNIVLGVQLLLFCALALTYVFNYSIKPETASFFLKFRIQTVLSLFITCLLGTLFPTVLHFGINTTKKIGTRFSDFYITSTLGSICGVIIASFFLLPKYGIEGTFLFLFIVLAIFFICINSFYKIVAGKASFFIIIILVGISVLSLWKINHKSVPNIFYNRFSHIENFEKISFFIEDERSTVTVLDVGSKIPDSEYTDGSLLMVDNCIGAGTTNFLLEAHYLGGLIPQYTLDHLTKAVSIGLGTGTTTKTLSFCPNIEQIVCVEISEGVKKAAQKIFAPFNKGIFENEKVTIHLGDGANFMQRTQTIFDVIHVDSFTLEELESFTLFTTDFYQICKTHLSKSGIILQWVAVDTLEEFFFKNVLATYHHVFPYVAVWQSSTGHIYFIGSLNKDIIKNPEGFDDWLSEFLKKDNHNEIIKKIDPKKLSLKEVLSVEDVDTYLKAYSLPLNTFDRPWMVSQIKKVKGQETVRQHFNLN